MEELGEGESDQGGHPQPQSILGGLVVVYLLDGGEVGAGEGGAGEGVGEGEGAGEGGLGHCWWWGVLDVDVDGGVNVGWWWVGGGLVVGGGCRVWM